MSSMVDFLLGLNDHVVHINFEHVTYFFSENFVHHSMIGSSRVLQTERHYVVVIVARLGHEGGEFFVPFRHGDLVVPRVCVHER